MKFFIDTANLQDIQSAYKIGVLSGVTTNPSLVAKEGVKFEDRIGEICQAVPEVESVSAEVTMWTPSDSKISINSADAVGSSLFAIRDGAESNTYVSKPAFFSSQAASRPVTPPPMTPAFLPGPL